jgi:hypothetical protein
MQKPTFSYTRAGLRSISPGVGSNFLVDKLMRPLSLSWLNIITCTIKVPSHTDLLLFEASSDKVTKCKANTSFFTKPQEA